MKNLENYVCTLEQAIRINESLYNEKSHGTTSDSLYYYFCTAHNCKLVSKEFFEQLDVQCKGGWIGICYSAFTSQELGELICSYLFPFGVIPCCFGKIEIDDDFYNISQWEVQVRAGFLIYLLENKKESNNE